MTIPERIRPVIRVFVSSTFSDLKLERNLLQERVFPVIERQCLAEGFQFQAIDLRWGVSAEAGLHHRTMRVCLEELRRCQDLSPEPNFLILLGDRYGWRPLPELISDEEYEKLGTSVDSDKERAVLDTWYRRDFNSIRPIYLLRERTDSPDGKNYGKSVDAEGKLGDTTNWLQVQELLWRVINRAFPTTELRNRFNASGLMSADLPSIVRFQASATEQEIWAGALSVSDAKHHVIAFFRSIGNREKYTPAEFEEFFDVTQSKEHDGSSFTAQQELKQAVRNHLGDDAVAPIPFSALHRHNEKVAIKALEPKIQTFCEDVETRLKSIIDRQICEYWRVRVSGARAAPALKFERSARELEIELGEHQRFAKERAPLQLFVGRNEENGPLAAIRNYLVDDSAYPLVVHGESGCGKTAILARAFQEIPADCNPIIRFIGTTPLSSDIRPLLKTLCEELRLRNPLGGELSNEVNALRNELQDHFRAASSKQPVVVFLDALDQLSDADGGRFTSWIPLGELPRNVKLVVSCLSDRDLEEMAGQPFREFQGRDPQPYYVQLDALSKREAHEFLFEKWLSFAEREVSERQKKAIVELFHHKSCRQPLYLKILYEEVRLWRSFDKPLQLGSNITEILGQLFARLQRDENHGQTLVQGVLGYVATALRGVTENEILELLFADPDYRDVLEEDNRRNHNQLPDNATRVPIVIWSRLRYDLAPYLTERSAPGGNVVTFYHRQVSEWIQRELVQKQNQDLQPHERLAKYFGRKKLMEESPLRHSALSNDSSSSTRLVNVRKVDELPYHQTLAALFSDLQTTLCNLAFLQAKTEAKLPYELVSDFDRVERRLLHSMPYDNPHRELKPIFRAFATAYSQEFHNFRDNSRIVAQQVFSNLYAHHGYEGSIGAMLLIFAESEEYPRGMPWLQRLNVSPNTAMSRPLRRTVSGHSGPVTALAISPDEAAIASGGTDGLILVWRPSDGSSLAAFRAHDCQVTSLTWGEEEKTLISAGDDRLIRIWDWRTGHLIRSWKAHLARIRDLIALPGRGHVVSCSDDKTVCIWDLSNGAKLQELRTHKERVFCLATDRNARLIASGGEDMTVKIWNAQVPGTPVVLRGHNKGVQGVAVSADARWAVSTGDDLMLRIWNLESGQPSRVLPAHSRRVSCVALGVGDLHSDENRSSEKAARTPFIVTGSDDSTLKLWDLASGAEVRTLRGHTAGINAVQVANSGSWLASASEDGTVRVWGTGLPDEAAPRVMEHKAQVNCLCWDSLSGGLFSGSSDGTVKLWDPSRGSLKRTYRGHQGPVTCLVTMPGDRVISGSADCTLRVWDASKGGTTKMMGNPFSAARLGDSINAELQLRQKSDFDNIDSAAVQTLAPLVSPLGHRRPVTCVVGLGQDSAISGGRDGIVCQWDLKSGKESAIFTGFNVPVEMLAASFKIGMVAAAGLLNEVLVWRIKKPTSPQVAHHHGSKVTALALSDAGFLASGCRDHSVCLSLLSAPDRPVKTLRGHAGLIHVLAFSPCGEILVSGGNDSEIRVWDCQTGELCHTLLGHTAPVRFVGIDSTGRIVYSAGEDQRLIAWDLWDGNAITQFLLGAEPTCLLPIASCAVAVGSRDGGIALLRFVDDATAYL